MSERRPAPSDARETGPSRSIAYAVPIRYGERSISYTLERERAIVDAVMACDGDTMPSVANHTGHSPTTAAVIRTADGERFLPWAPSRWPTVSLSHSPTP